MFTDRPAAELALPLIVVVGMPIKPMKVLVLVAV